MAIDDTYVFPGFLTPVLTLPFFPKPPTTFLTCFCRGERRKYPGKKSRQTHNHQVTSWTRSPLSHPGGADSKLQTFAEDNFLFDKNDGKFPKGQENAVVNPLPDDKF